MSSKLRAGLLALLLACPALAAAGGGTVAVLSSGGGAYMEAFSAFQAAYGTEVPFVNLAVSKPRIPADTSLVVAFGGKAANYSYPPGVSIVYCMAPGLFLNQPFPAARSAKIGLVPEFSEIVSQLKEIQPGLKRLRIFWMTPDFAKFEQLVVAEGTRRGIEITSVKVPSSEDFPSILRQAAGASDAFWVPPDPLLITPENLQMMHDFSWANGIPFYGSTKGMTVEGAVASVGVSFREMGATAAGVALRLAAGENFPGMVFPAKAEVTLNASAARKCGIDFSPQTLRKAAYLFP